MSTKNFVFTLFSLALAGAPLHQAFAGCIPAGSTDVQINAALHSTGLASLCPNTVYNLYNTITFTGPGQEISTAGYPTDGSRATLVVMGSSMTRAIAGVGFSGIRILNIQVNGNRPGLGYVPAGTNGMALIEIGGISRGQIVQEVHAYEPRSWSTLHIYEGAVGNPNDTSCSGAQILNNQIGPAGQPSNKQWADGISLGCTHSTVQGNVVTDATDGGIVVFGAPGSLISGNTVQSLSRVLMGGINLVDWAPYNGNYTGTVVTGNTIYSGPGTGYIKIGIGMGPAVWSAFSPAPGGPNYGATVTNNIFEGNSFGYATAANGAVNFDISGNVLGGATTPTFDGLEDSPCTSSNQWPIPFANSGTVTDGICLTPQFNFAAGGFVSHNNQQINMGSLMFAVMQSDGNFVVYGAPGQALWATGTEGAVNCAVDCLAQFQGDGNLVLYYATLVSGTKVYHPYWSSGTAGRGAYQIRFSPDPNHVFQIVTPYSVLYQAS
jgi:parallel beta-helix repeat protein